MGVDTNTCSLCGGGGDDFRAKIFLLLKMHFEVKVLSFRVFRLVKICS